MRVFETCLACDSLLLGKGSGVEVTFMYEENYVTETICKECNLDD